MLSVLATILFASLIAACGGGDGEQSDGDSTGGSSSDPTAAASVSIDGDSIEVTSDDSALTLQIPAGTDGAGEITATAIDGGWELGPDGTSFGEPLIAEFTVPHNGGLPVALLESSGGSVELPLQFVSIEGGQARFTVAVAHFTELVALELTGAPDGAGPDSVFTFEVDRAGIASREEFNRRLDDIEAGHDLDVPANRDELWLDTTDGLTLEDVGDGWQHIAVVNDDGDLAIVTGSGGDTPGGDSGGFADSGGGDAGSGGRDFLAFPSGGFEIEDAEDIADAVTVALVEGGYLFRLAIPESANQELTLANGGRFQVAVTWATAETVIESMATTDEGVDPAVIVRRRSDFSEIEREDTAAESRIEGNEAFVFFPAQILDGELAAFINDSIYSGIEVIDVGAWSRDGNGENVWVGAVGGDVEAFANLGP